MALIKVEQFFMELNKRLVPAKLSRNIFANYLTVIWMGSLSILLIPFYLRFLGADQWGIVAICMLLQGFFNLLDAGLGQIMPRDIARVAHNHSLRHKTYLVYFRAYLTLAIFGFILGQLAVPLLVSHWFSGGQSFSLQDSWAFHLVAVQFLFQFANNANVGYWNGTEQQVLANTRQCIFGALKHLGALALICFWQAQAIAYLIPFVLISMIEFFQNRKTVKSELSNVPYVPIIWADYQKLAHEAGALFIGVLIGMLASQMDRIILSKYLDLASFGIYVIVANLGLAFMQLQLPLIKAFLPRITKDNEGGLDTGSLRRLFISLLVLCALPCLILAWQSPRILQLWIGSPDVVSAGALPLRLFFCSVAINALYQMVYLQILISGNGKWVVKTNTLVLFIILPILWFSIPFYGTASGGIYWLSMTVLQLLFGLIWLLFSRK